MATKKVREPKLGETVLFHAPGFDRPGVVTTVWSENVVNLFVFPDGSHDTAQQFVSMRTSVVQGDDAGHWSFRD